MSMNVCQEFGDYLASSGPGPVAEAARTRLGERTTTELSALVGCLLGPNASMGTVCGVLGTPDCVHGNSAGYAVRSGLGTSMCSFMMFVAPRYGLVSAELIRGRCCLVGRLLIHRSWRRTGLPRTKFSPCLANPRARSRGGRRRPGRSFLEPSPSATASLRAHRRNSRRIFTWLLDQTTDDRGNVIVYEYKAEDLAGVASSVAEQHRLNGAAAFTNQHLKRVHYGVTTRPTPS